MEDQIIISINGKTIEKEKASIPLTSDAFLFGYGVYETLRTYKGQLFRVGDHLKRLEYSARTIGLKMLKNISDIEKEITFFVGQLTWEESKLKVILTQKDLIFMAEKLTEKDVSMHYYGIKLLRFDGERALPEAKTLGNPLGYMAKAFANANQAYDALLVDALGLVRECAQANVFWVKQDRLFTVDSKVLKGVTRQAVIELAENCLFEEISYQNLLKADEIFITQTSSGILPVSAIDRFLIGNGTPGPVTKALMDKFLTTVWGLEF